MQNQTFGKRINQLRKNKGITSEQLAEICEVNAVHIRQIESGSRMPSLPLFMRICNALGTSADFLLGEALVNPVIPDSVDQLGKQLKHLSPNQIDMVNDIIKVMIKYITIEK